MGNVQDQENLCPNYRFIIENLDILITDVDLWTIKKKFPERKEVSRMHNQKLLYLKKDIIQEVENKTHNLIFFNAYQWESIVKKLKEAENAI